MDVVPQAPAHPPASAWRAWWRRALASARDPNARGWYGGAAFGILFQAFTLVAIWSMPIGVLQRTVATVVLVVFAAGFLVTPPLVWWAGRRERMIAVSAYWLVSLVFFPLIGSTAFWVWLLVAVVAAVIFEDFATVAAITTVLVVVPLGYGFVTGFDDAAPYSAIITFSLAAMMFGMNKQIRAVRELRRAQSEVARLAVVEERARFSRDMHDMLGHSLTVVTVKSELARKLVSLDPARAEDEIADIERLSRGALADLRAAVAGYREMSLSTELAAAQATLAAADIQAHLPRNAQAVDPALSELFGWVLREGVTNVIRHSGAKNCWVEVGRDSLTISDDGRGMPVAGAVRGAGAAGAPGAAATAGAATTADSATTAGAAATAGAATTADSATTAGAVEHGNGLDGLSVRARRLGARIVTGISPSGGFELTVRRTKA